MATGFRKAPAGRPDRVFTGMKIVQIIDTLNVGGAEKVLVNLSNLLHRHGHSVTVITLLEPGLLASQLLPGVQLHALRRGWKWNPLQMWRLVQWCRPFEVIHVHSSHNLRYLFLASRLFLLRKPIFFHEHYGDIEIDQSVSWHQRLIYPKTILIGVSGKICDWAIHQLQMPTNQVYRLMNTVPKYEISENCQSTPDETIRLVLVSNIRRTKNLEFAIAVLNELNTTRSARLMIIGGIVEPSYYQTLLQLIEQFQLTDRVDFVHDCSEIQPLLKNYDLALHTARSESGPLVLIEYMVQGLPFLSYRTGEVVANIQTQLPEHVLEHFEISEWVKAIEKILGKDRSELFQKLVSIYDTYFSEKVYYQKCLQIYQENLGY